MAISVLPGQLGFSVADTAQDVACDLDEPAGFPKGKSLERVAIQESVHRDQQIDQQIKAAPDAEYAQRWIENTGSEQADKDTGYPAGSGQQLRRPAGWRNVNNDGMVSGLKEWNS